MTTRPSVSSPASFTEFGKLLRYLRRRARLTQMELAAAVGYTNAHLCRLENGQRLPDLTTLAALFVPALSLDDEPTWASRLLELGQAATARKPDTPTPTTPSRLPTSLTPVVGREAELTLALKLLRQPETRLLTLVGPPGAGKTRLSLEVAASLVGDFADGVYLVDLAACDDATQLIQVLAHALDVSEVAGQLLLTSLQAKLNPRTCLLVLDNFEQLVGSGPTLTQLLKAASGVKALVTSREALGVYGEHELLVSPLGLPDLRALPEVATLARYPALELFVQRAQAVRPDFRLTPDNAATIAEICVCLDGLPLALEMAAPRLKRLTPANLLTQLQHRLSLLKDGPRDWTPRQQTLRGALDWSYNLLRPAEQHTFAGLAVFAGGASVIAAQTVLTDDAPAPEWLSPELESLVSKNLVRFTASPAQPADEPRVWMLETLREYALEKLETGDQAAELRQRHAAYYLDLAQTAEVALDTARQKLWFRRLEVESHNLRAALQWCVEHQPEMGLRLTAALFRFWLIRGPMSEGRAWFERLLNHPDFQQMETGVRARALSEAGLLFDLLGDRKNADQFSEESLRLYRQLEDKPGLARAMSNLAGVYLTRNAYASAVTLLNEALALYRELNHSAGLAQILNPLGQAAKEQGHYAQANAYFEESLKLHRALEDGRGVVLDLNQLSTVAYWLGDYARVESLARQSLSAARELGNKAGMGLALDNLGMALYKQGDAAQALTQLKESLHLYWEVGNKSGQAMVLTDMGTVTHALGDDARAVQLHREGFLLAHEIGDQRRAAFCLEGMGIVLATQSPDRAAQLLSAARIVRLAINSPLPEPEQAEVEQAVALARAWLEPVTFETYWTQGQTQTFDQLAEFVNLLETS